jgi:NADP+-dependent farnesol dehydrogenase
MDMDRWRGRTAVVTGASSGIGMSVARSLAGHGMRVAGVGRKRERLDELASLLDGFTAYEVDLRDERRVLELFREVGERLGGVDVMVNCAGLGYPASVMDGETDRWREMFDVNVMSLLLCTREALRDMRRRGVDGHVIFVSSMSAYRVSRRFGVYAATKFAVRALTETLRQELLDEGLGTRVTAVSPGLVRTGFAERFEGSREAGERLLGDIVVLEPEDVAGAVVYALSQPPHVQIHDVLFRSVEQP